MELRCVPQFLRCWHPHEFHKSSLYCFETKGYYHLQGWWKTWARKLYFSRALESNRRVQVCYHRSLNKLYFFKLLEQIIVFRLKNLYRSGIEKSRLSNLKKRKKKKEITYRSKISNILIYFPSHCRRKYVAEGDPISPSSLLLLPHTAIPNASFFCSISFAF